MDISADALKHLEIMANRKQKPEVVTVDHPSGEKLSFLVTYDGDGGMNAKDITSSLEQFDETPLRRKGTAGFETLDSFIDHANRFQNTNSALFATKLSSDISIQCVIDYHDRVNDLDGEEHADAKPRHGQHRGRHDFPLSEEYKKWLAISERNEPLDTREFSYFLEDNIIDVMFLPDFLRPDGKAPETPADQDLLALIQKLEGKPCGPEKLMNLAKGLQVNEDTKIKAFYDRNSGQSKIGFESEHTDAEGNKLDVPNMFLISIPVFNGDQHYRIPVRLRYRPRGGTVVWMMELHRPDIFLEDAFKLACSKAANETGLPLFYGNPE
nr:DUF2303 family protein [uncultured Cohaesibacter sp.]